MIILLTDHHPGILESIRTDLKSRYGITDVELSTRFIRDLPRSEDGYSVHHLKQACITDYYPLKDACHFIDDITDLQTIADVVASEYIKPVITWTDDLDITKQWLHGIERTYDTIAVDFEATNLALPQFNPLTMVTLGWNLTKSIVIVFKDSAIQDYVLNWLVTTPCRQVYHNALYDIRLVHYHTGKFPRNIEDSQLLASVYRNHVDTNQRKTGLKELAKYPYLDWASDKTSFELYVDSFNYINANLHYVGSNPTPHMYNLPLIYYCGIDACATNFVWTKFATELAHPSEWVMPTSEPRYNTEGFNQRYYYDFILKPAIPVIVEMLNYGQAIDIDQVHTLKQTVDDTKVNCMQQINEFQIVKDFMGPLDQERTDKFLAPVLKAWKHPQSAGYKNNVAMRTFIVNYYDGTSFDKVSASDLKSMNTHIAQLLHTKQFDHPDILAGSIAFEESECLRQNTAANRIDKVIHPEKYITLGFNPFNYSQLTKMWKHFGLESDEVSKDTGEMSFSGDVLKELAKTTSGDVKQILKLHLEISEAKNMITQYIPKYIGSTIDGRVYGSIRLFGTISGRLSGKAPKLKDEDPLRHSCGINLVTQPSSSSAFAKPVKKLFIAPKGKLLVQIDYANLEGHVGAILTHDETSVRNLQQNFDTHCLHSAAYWTDAWERISSIPFDKTSITVNEQYKALCDINSEAKHLRSESKKVTFGLSYGAYPPKVAKQVGCSIGEAIQIFDNFHNLLYPGVTAYRENYVMPQVKQHGFIHLNWGLKLLSSDAKRDIRTLGNSTMQSYSDLTQIAAVEFDKVLKPSPFNESIHLVNIVHDCLYYEIDNDINVIKYINDTLPPIMCKQFVIDQEMPIKAEIDIGPSLANCVTLPNNANIATIQAKLAALS